MKSPQDVFTTARRSDLISSLGALSHFLLVLAPVYITGLVGPGPGTLMAWLWFGFGMNGLINLMHEAAHYHAFRPRWASDALGRWVLGPLALADFDGYRHRHWEHHRRLGEPDDPKVTYHMSIRGYGFLFLSLRCLFLVEAVRKLFLQIRGGTGDDDTGVLAAGAPAPGWVLRTAIFQVAFFSSIWVVALVAVPGNP